MAAPQPDPGGEIASLLSAEFTAESMEGELVAISIRLPPPRLAVIDAMAKKAGISRNRMANMLLSAGIQDVFKRLPSQVMADLSDDIDEEIL